MDRVQLQLGCSLLNQNGAWCNFACESKHFLIEGSGKEKDLYREVKSAEHLRDADNVLSEGCVVQHFVCLINDETDQVRVVEGLTHQSSAERSD